MSISYVYTRDEIAQFAAEKSQNIGSVPLATKLLEQVLLNLYTNWEWGFLRKKTTLTFSAGAVSPTGGLPDDYNKPCQLKWLDTSSSPTAEQTITFKPFADFSMLIQPSQLANNPSIFTIDPLRGSVVDGSQQATMYIYPGVDASQSFYFWYYHIPARQTTNVPPLFPDHAFLIDAVVNELRGVKGMRNYDPIFIRRHIYQVRQNLGENTAITVKTAPLDKSVFRPHVPNRRNGWE